MQSLCWKDYIYKGSNEEGIETKIKSRNDGWEGMGKDSFVHTNEGNFVLILAYKYLVYTGVSTEQE